MSSTSSPDAAAKADARRGEALAVLEAARDSAATNAVRQCVRVLAHEEAHRAPAVSRKASRQASGPAGSGPGTGAVALVLVRRGEDKAAPASVAFAVPGRCDEEGLSVSPEVDAESARRLLAPLREVAGASRRAKK